MDNFLRDLINKEFKIGKWTFTFLEALLVICITGTGIMLRASVFDYVSQDYTGYWDIWFTEIRKYEGLSFLLEDFYDYTPPFMYILYFLSKFENPMYAFKTMMCVMDFILTIVTCMLVWEGTRSRKKTWLTYGLMAIMPTVIANSALWTQCDAIYTTLLLFCLYFFMKEKPARAMIFYGIAFAFKLQTIFLFPVLVVLWLKNRVQIRHFFLVPLIYVIAMIPACLAGKPLLECLLVYVNQNYTDTWMLTLNWPNIYEIIGKEQLLTYYSTAGKCLSVAMLMCIFYYMAKKEYKITKEFLIQMSLFFAIFVVYFLPFMHERYGYVADVLAVIYAMYRPKRFFVPMLHITISYVAYTSFLSKTTTVPLLFYAFLLLGILVIVGMDVYAHVSGSGKKEKKEVCGE